MTHSTQQGRNPWGDAWLEAQRKYFDTWADLSRQASESSQFAHSTPASEKNPFIGAFDQWWQLLSPHLPEAGREAGERLKGMNEGYLRIGEQIWQLAQNLHQVQHSGDAWQGLVEQQVKAWQQQFSDAANPFAQESSPWGLPLQHWQQLYSSFAIMPAELEKALQQGGPLSSEALQKALHNGLSTPTLGYSREMQQETQQWAKLWLEHLEVLRRYQSLFNGLSGQTAEQVGQKIIHMAKEGQQVESLRQAYDIWIDCAEQAYAKLANSAEFSEIQAQLTNTLMRVKQHEQKLGERGLKALNLPTRTELDSAHQRIHELRRELRILHQQQEDQQPEALQRQLDEMRQEIDKLKASPPPAPQKASPRRTPKAKPKTTTHDNQEG